MQSYCAERKQRTKMNQAHSSWEGILFKNDSFLAIKNILQVVLMTTLFNYDNTMLVTI